MYQVIAISEIPISEICNGAPNAALNNQTNFPLALTDELKLFVDSDNCVRFRDTNSRVLGGEFSEVDIVFVNSLESWIMLKTKRNLQWIADAAKYNVAFKNVATFHLYEIPD